MSLYNNKLAIMVCEYLEAYYPHITNININGAFITFNIDYQPNCSYKIKLAESPVIVQFFKEGFCEYSASADFLATEVNTIKKLYLIKGE